MGAMRSVKASRWFLPLGVALAIAAAALVVPPAEAATPGPPPKEPVVLVHGAYGASSGMETMRRSFEAAGYPAFAVNLPGQNNITNAQFLTSYVANVKALTGTEKVHPIGPTTGGLLTRHY